MNHSYVLYMFSSTKHLDPAVARNRDLLAGIVAMLAAMVGLRSGRVVERIEKALRLEVLRILRPAEAAVRRLIFIAAHGVVAKTATTGAAPDFANFPRGERKPKRPSFRLADPMAPMVGHHVMSDAASGPVPFAQRGPRIRSIAPVDPTVPALLAMRRTKPDRPDDDDVRSAALIDRLQAIASALDNIPRQAQRLARWTARRAQAAQHRLVYTSPLRAGPPPGSRKEPVHEVDRILSECHIRAFDVRRLTRQPDTS
jgi:hypothetical protein